MDAQKDKLKKYAEFQDMVVRVNTLMRENRVNKVVHNLQMLKDIESGKDKVNCPVSNFPIRKKCSRCTSPTAYAGWGDLMCRRWQDSSKDSGK